MKNWTVRVASLKGVFANLQTTADLDGDEINANWMSRLTRVKVGAEAYYIKLYTSRGRGLRRWLGRSRVRAEWENQTLFARMGLPTAEVIAYGETSAGARYQGALVTRELKETVDLARLHAQNHARLADRQWRYAVIIRLADIVRSLHRHGFVHNDLKWRNILVDEGRNPEVYIIDCPMGGMRWGPLLSRGIVKDLACLDKVARKALSRTDRLRFYLAYKQRAKLVPADVRQIRRVCHFFDGRD